MEEKIPQFLLENLSKQYNEEILKKIIEGYNAKRFVTFRVNTIKTTVTKVEETLIKNNIEYEKVKWSKEAFIVKNVKEDIIKKLDIYINGEIYLQSLSSMIPAIILEPKEGENILDMAAAPGGKTTQIATITNNKSYITATEINKIRADRLKFNIEKQGVAGVNIMIQDARDLDSMFSFDRILLDAPCSGSGTINLNKEKTNQKFNENILEKITKTQTKLLRKAIEILKSGKEMVYSTCSILQSENEDILEKILKEKKAEIIPINIEQFEEIPILKTKLKGTITICPNELYEGFFVAKIRKI